MQLLIDLTPLLTGGENGGAKWFTLELLRCLPDHMPGWTFSLLTTAGNDVYLSNALPGFKRFQIINDRGEALPVNPENLPDGSVASLLYCPFTAPFHAVPNVPTVATVYDLQFDAYPLFFTPSEAAERQQFTVNAAQKCTKLVCISNYTREHFLRFTQTDPARVDVIYITIPSRISEVTSDTSINLPVTSGRYLIFPANAWPHKNHHMLLVAFSMWRAKHPENDLKLVFTGVKNSASGEEIEKAIWGMGLGEHVVMPGFLSEAALGCLMKQARAMIFPSLFEGFGMPLLEAMEAGVPVLCSNTTSLPEIAGNAALMFDPRAPDSIVTAIERIEGEPDLAPELVRLGRERVDVLGDTNTMTEKYAQIFIQQAETGASVIQPAQNETKPADKDAFLIRLARWAKRKFHRLLGN